MRPGGAPPAAAILHPFGPARDAGVPERPRACLTGRSCAACRAELCPAGPRQDDRPRAGERAQMCDPANFAHSLQARGDRRILGPTVRHNGGGQREDLRVLGAAQMCSRRSPGDHFSGVGRIQRPRAPAVRCQPPVAHCRAAPCFPSRLRSGSPRLRTRTRRRHPVRKQPSRRCTRLSPSHPRWLGNPAVRAQAFQPE